MGHEMAANDSIGLWGYVFCLRDREKPFYSRPIIERGAYVGSCEISAADLPFAKPDPGATLDGCRELLYESYVVEQGWKVPGTEGRPPSPTRFEFRMSARNRPMLCDRFDECGWWVTLLDGEGAVRACKRCVTDADLDLDMLAYPGARPIREWALAWTAGLTEVSRLAICGGVRGSLASLILLSDLVDHLYRHSPDTYSVASIPLRAPTLYFSLHIGGILVPHWAFRYSEDDRKPVNVVLYETTHTKHEKDRYLHMLRKIGYSKL